MTKIVRIYHTHFIAYVDDEDYDMVRRHRWILCTHTSPNYYVETRRPIRMYMHRFIYPAPPGLVIHHKNGNGLDNRRENLVHITRHENAQTRRMRSDNTSGVTGVRQHRGWWIAEIRVDSKNIYLGKYSSFDKACEIRRMAEIEYGRTILQ